MKQQSPSTYSNLLKDPRWQKKRLEVMQRDNFSCTQCEDKTKTLNVHHIHYIRGNNPWEYPLSGLITLCENCHSSRRNNIGDDLLLEMFNCGADDNFIDNLMIGFHNFSKTKPDIEDISYIDSVICRFLEDSNFREIVTKFYFEYLDRMDEK